jgi:hypothetical protein
VREEVEKLHVERDQLHFELRLHVEYNRAIEESRDCNPRNAPRNVARQPGCDDKKPGRYTE